MANAQPDGVRSVWYFLLRSVFVAPQMPVKEEYVTVELTRYATKFSKFFQLMLGD